MSRNNSYVSIQHMLDSARDALELFEERSRRGDLDTDEMMRGIVNDALVRRMEVVGEAARRVPEDFRSRHPEIAWLRIIGLCNRLIHEYDRVDLDTLQNIIQNELPPLVGQLEAILEDGE